MSTSAAVLRLITQARCPAFVYAGPDFEMRSPTRRLRQRSLYPLHLLPFGLVAFLWQAATIGALYGAIRISQRLPEARAGAAAVKLTPAIVRSSRQTPRLRRRRPTLR